MSIVAYRYVRIQINQFVPEKAKKPCCAFEKGTANRAKNLQY